MPPPPGLLLLVHNFPQLIAPPSVLYLLHTLARDFLDVHTPSVLIFFTCLISPFAFIILQFLWIDRRNEHAAAAVNAVLPPKVESKSFMGLDIILQLAKGFKEGYPADDFAAWTEKYGYTYSIRSLFDYSYFTSEPQYIKNILATEFSNFEKGAKAFERLKSVLGTGVFNSDGDMWKFHRTMTRPFFTKERISDFDIYDRHAEDVINQIKARLREGHPIDFQDAIGRFTLDSATEFLYGSDVRSLAAGLPYPAPSSEEGAVEPNPDHPANRFAKAFGDAQNVLSIRARYGLAWSLFEPTTDKSVPHMTAINAFIEPILKQAVEKKKQAARDNVRPLSEKEKTEVKEGETLLDHMGKFTEDETVLKDEILNMLVAGRDTTAATLTFAMYAMSQHPHVFERLREEVLSKVGMRRPTYDDVREMKYLRAVINETLRLFPIVPFNARSTINPTTWKSSRADGKPFYIPAGTRVRYSVLLMHRRTELWGPDALEFDPDRFIDERLHKYLTPNPFIFVPFNAGPRICLGQQFAYNESSFMLIRLAQHFRSIALSPEAQPTWSRPPASWANGPGRTGIERVRPATSLTLYVLGGLWVKMEESGGEEVV